LLNLREKIKKANDNLDFELATLYAVVIVITVLFYRDGM